METAANKFLASLYKVLASSISLAPTRVDVSPQRENYLHMTACIFDPLGFFVPTVLKPKLFMKNLWNERLDWDEKLDDGLLKEWLEISEKLGSIPLYNLPRFVGITTMKLRSMEYRLVCF